MIRKKEDELVRIAQEFLVKPYGVSIEDSLKLLNNHPNPLDAVSEFEEFYHASQRKLEYPDKSAEYMFKEFLEQPKRLELKMRARSVVISELEKFLGSKTKIIFQKDRHGRFTPVQKPEEQKQRYTPQTQQSATYH